MRGCWKIVFWVNLALSACTASREASDVVALMQRGQLRPGYSSRRQVVQVLGRRFVQEKYLLHGKMSNGGDQTNRWTMLDYARLGIECIVMETTAGPRLYRLTLKPPYARPVLDSVRLGRQSIGQLARVLSRPITSWPDNRSLRLYEVQGYVMLDSVRVEARVQLDSATWNRCRLDKKLLDSIVAAAPISRVTFSKSSSKQVGKCREAVLSRFLP
jgi:hypothetical protein